MIAGSLSVVNSLTLASVSALNDHKSHAISVVAMAPISVDIELPTRDEDDPVRLSLPPNSTASLTQTVRWLAASAGQRIGIYETDWTRGKTVLKDWITFPRNADEKSLGYKVS
jgi:hypothetical protein